MEYTFYKVYFVCCILGIFELYFNIHKTNQNSLELNFDHSPFLLMYLPLFSSLFFPLCLYSPSLSTLLFFTYQPPSLPLPLSLSLYILHPPVAH